MTSRTVDLREWVKPILVERARHDENWYIKHWWKRWAYSAKLITCIVLGRDIDKGYGDDPYEGIEVAYSNFHSTYSFDYGEGADFNYIRVGAGFRHGWWYLVGSDGWP